MLRRKIETILQDWKNKDVYHVDSALKLGNYNVGRSGGMLTLPLYMAFLLREY